MQLALFCKYVDTYEKKKKKNAFFLLCGGSQTRTDDLWVMSPTSYHCSIPRYFDCKGRENLGACQGLLR